MVLLLALFLGGMYLLSVYDALYHQRDFLPSSWSTTDGGLLSTWGWSHHYQRIAAVWAGLTFLWTAWVGYRSSETTNLSKGLIGIGGLGAVWMVILFLFPDHITLPYVFGVWIIYIVGGIVSSAYLMLQDRVISTTMYVETDDTVLDDQWDSESL